MNATKASTQTNPPRSWRIKGKVRRLREHSQARVYDLPVPPRALRAGTRSDIRLDHPSVSREHAEIVPFNIEGTVSWRIHDLRSKNGLRCDGQLRTSFVLQPGVEVSLGALKLIAESDELIGLRSMLQLFLGWAPDKQDRVDEAMRSLRNWAALDAALLVVGDGDLVPVVRRLHNLVIGAEAPFSAYVPTENLEEATASVSAAGAGTLCVTPSSRAIDAVAAVDHVRKTSYGERPLLALCAADATSAATIMDSLERLVVIHVPSLASRPNELDDIIQTYAQEIAKEHGLPKPGITMHDLEQLGAQQYQGLAAIESAALRTIMLRTWGTNQAAEKLGIDPSTLWEWRKVRGLEK